MLKWKHFYYKSSQFINKQEEKEEELENFQFTLFMAFLQDEYKLFFSCDG